MLPMSCIGSEWFGVVHTVLPSIIYGEGTGTASTKGSITKEETIAHHVTSQLMCSSVTVSQFVRHMFSYGLISLYICSYILDFRVFCSQMSSTSIRNWKERNDRIMQLVPCCNPVGFAHRKGWDAMCVGWLIKSYFMTILPYCHSVGDSITPPAPVI